MLQEEIFPHTFNMIMSIYIIEISSQEGTFTMFIVYT